MALHEHQAEGQITVLMVEGSIRFDALDEHRIFVNDELLTLQGGIRHAVKALEDSAFVITIVNNRKAA